MAWSWWETSTGSGDPVVVLSIRSRAGRPRSRDRGHPQARARARSEHSARTSGRRSCQTALLDGDRRTGQHGRAQRASGVVKSRSGGPRRDAERLGNLDQGQPEVVVQDEDSPLVERDMSEGALDLVSVRELAARIGGRGTAEIEHSNAGGALPSASRLGIAGVDQDPVDPGVEALAIPEVWQLSPGGHEGVLQRSEERRVGKECRSRWSPYD